MISEPHQNIGGLNEIWAPPKYFLGGLNDIWGPIKKYWGAQWYLSPIKNIGGLNDIWAHQNIGEAQWHPSEIRKNKTTAKISARTLTQWGGGRGNPPPPHDFRFFFFLVWRGDRSHPTHPPWWRPWFMIPLSSFMWPKEYLNMCHIFYNNFSVIFFSMLRNAHKTASKPRFCQWHHLSITA